MIRADGRKPDEMRPAEITIGVQKDPAGSAQISLGRTLVLCAATVAEGVPNWIKGEGRSHGWITGEYAMLPGSTPGRVPRQRRGRSEEIQRLIGRSLRAAVDLSALGERTITIDCDVLQADGGTRAASITGGYIALVLAVRKLLSEIKINRSPIRRPVCAVSCAVIDGTPVLDPDHQEDQRAEVDMNFVLTRQGEFVEIQGTAEGKPFDREILGQMITLARHGAEELIRIQQKILK